MAQSVPQTVKQWNLVGHDGLSSLHFEEKPVPELGDTQVLVKLHGASINFRDHMLTLGTYPWDMKLPIIPGSDGAGVVVATGKRVSRFQPGDKVVTVLNPHLIAGPFVKELLQYGLGATQDGTFRTVGAFDEHGLVRMPEGLSYAEAATLSCAGVSAWSALFGLEGKKVRAGDWVLTLGTGGVSIFALQFAKVVGARVIATTSSDEKAQLLKRLGADHVINYRETPEWGALAKELTGGVGVDHVIEVGGPNTLKQSVASLKYDGDLVVMGAIGGLEETKNMPTLLEVWLNQFTARTTWAGTRVQMEEMGRAIEANIDRLRPVVDSRVFKLEELKEAIEYMVAGKHQGNVYIEIP
ncbi:hypothetical protein M426DRAFT_154307 [Hypoxylon sp. CI-4A]|nr:hypothetical protein M426DRAFT_154307 [Hypoxylon sp. CI-4A]